MPAPAFRLHQSKTEKIFLDSEKTLDFFNELCYNRIINRGGRQNEKIFLF